MVNIDKANLVITSHRSWFKVNNNKTRPFRFTEVDCFAVITTNDVITIFCSYSIIWFKYSLGRVFSFVNNKRKPQIPEKKRSELV